MRKSNCAAPAIGATEWMRLRGVTPEVVNGVPYLTPNAIAKALGEDMALRYTGLVMRAQKWGTIEGNVASRAITHSRPPGTIGGEIDRTWAQLKGYPIAVVMMQGGQIARDLSGSKSTGYTAGHLAALMITSTLLGAIAMSAKDIRAGKDPRRMLDEETYRNPLFWGAALMQGGGMGIYGDFLFSGLDRNGNSLANTFAGPLVGRIDNLRDLTLGNAQKALTGKETKFNRGAIDFARQNAPFVGFWYWDIAVQRLLFDRLQKWADPHAHQSFQQMQSRVRREYRQEYWWAPGEDAARRLPDLTRMFATR